MAAAEAEAAAWACMQLNMERRQRFTRSATLNFTTATHDGCKTVYRAYRNRGKTLTLVVTLRVSGGRDIYNRGLPRVLYSARIRAVSRSPADRPMACPVAGPCDAAPHRRARARAPAMRPLTRCAYANKPPDRDAHRTPLPAAPHSHPPPGAGVC